MQGTALSRTAPVGNHAAKEFKKSPRGQSIDNDQRLSASSAGERTPSRTKSLTTTGGPEGATRRLSRDERLLRHWDQRLRSDFLPFYESASLDPLIRERVHSLLLDQRLTVQDIYDLSRKQNLTYEQHSKLRSEVTDELNTSLQGFLSPDQYAEFSKHNHMLIATELANTTLRQFSARNIPYTDDTSEKLIAILKAFPPGRFKYDPMTSHIAKRQLSPQQAAVLEEILDKGYLRH